MTLTRVIGRDKMGKKNRKQQQQAKRKLCFTLNDRSSLKTVEEIWESEYYPKHIFFFLSTKA